jgi:F-type H+-transporting ATPase subunit c
LAGLPPRPEKEKEGKADMSTMALLIGAGPETIGNLIGGNIHVGLAALGAAISVGMIGMSASAAVGRNPGASTKVLVQSILSIAFAEAIVFYTLFLVKA